MRKRLVIGIVFFVASVVVFLLGYAEITFSIREDYMSSTAIFPATLLALIGITQFIKVMRLKNNL